MHKDELAPLLPPAVLNMTITTTYVGVDVAKASLQVHLQGRQYQFENTSEGHTKFCKKLATLSCPHVICEATGGYEAALAQALHQAKILVSVLNPAHVRAAIQAQGKRAKTDRLDAASLTDYGQRFQPKPTPALEASQRQLTQWVRWLKQLIEARAVAKEQAEHHTDSFVQQQHEELIEHFTKQIKVIEQQIETLLSADKAVRERVECLTSIKGVGLRTALIVLVHMPELGTLNRGKAAALAGLAPWTRESGQLKGKSCIGGGRADVRPALYMSSLSAIRYNTILKAFFQRLVAKNKPGKVALTAVMRKLLIYMNHKLKVLAAEQENGAANWKNQK